MLQGLFNVGREIAANLVAPLFVWLLRYRLSC